MKSISDDQVEAFEAHLESYLEEAFGEEHGITGLEDLCQVLDEHKQIINFLPWAMRLHQRALEEKLELKFHVYCDNTDDFLSNPAEALELYIQHRIEGQPNVRLWYELGEDEAQEYEENHMIGWGNFPS